MASVSGRHRRSVRFIAFPPNKKAPAPTMGTRTETQFCGTTLFAGSPRPLIPMPTHRLPHNAGNASKDTQAQPFPSALGGPFAAPLFALLSAMQNSLWMRLQFYFRFFGLVLLVFFIKLQKCPLVKHFFPCYTDSVAIFPILW